MSETCSGCRYWKRTSNDTHYPKGACRYNPPRSRDDDRYGTWAKTHPDEWCGKWRELRTRRERRTQADLDE